MNPRPQRIGRSREIAPQIRRALTGGELAGTMGEELRGATTILDLDAPGVCPVLGRGAVADNHQPVDLLTRLKIA